MKELKPGMLCLVIGLTTYAEDNGKAVELIRFIKDGESFVTPNGFTRTKYEDGWLSVGNVDSPRGEKGWCCYRAKNLMPLEDDGDNETMDEHVESTMGMES